MAVRAAFGIDLKATLSGRMIERPERTFNAVVRKKPGTI